MAAGGASSGSVGRILAAVVLAGIWGHGLGGGQAPRCCIPHLVFPPGLSRSAWGWCFPPPGMTTAGENLHLKFAHLTVKSGYVNLLPSTRNEPAQSQSCLPCNPAFGCVAGIIPHSASVGCWSPTPHLAAQEPTALSLPVPLPLHVLLANLDGNLIILVFLLKTPVTKNRLQNQKAEKGD